MTITFPIPVNIQQLIFGSGLATLPMRPGLAEAFLNRVLPGQAPGGWSPERLLEVQEHLYRSTVKDYRTVRTRLREDLYALPWFLVGFHGWYMVARLLGFASPPWLTIEEDAGVLSAAMFELGIEQETDEVGALVSALTASRAEDRLQNADIHFHVFAELVIYASSAAIRRGHRGPLYPPAYSVFVSYAHADVEFVDSLARFLEMNGVSTWYDTSDLKSATTLDGRLVEAIHGKEAFVVVLSEEALGRPYVCLEIREALAAGKLILPLARVPLERVTRFRDPRDGADLGAQLMTYSVMEGHGIAPVDAYRLVLRSLQKTSIDTTRWRADEGGVVGALSTGSG